MRKLLILSTILAACSAGGEGPELFEDTGDVYEADAAQLGADEQRLEPVGNCACKRLHYVDHTCIEREGQFIGQKTAVAEQFENILESDYDGGSQNLLLPTVSMSVNSCVGIKPEFSSLGYPTSYQGVPLTCWYVRLVKHQCGFDPTPVPVPIPD